MTPTDLEKNWTRWAKSVSRRINLGWWWQKTSLISAATLLVIALAILCLRSIRSTEFQSVELAIGVGATLLLAGAVGWILSRNRFVGVGEGFVRLDERLQMCNQLATASAGVGKWPDFSTPDPDRVGLRWNWAVAVLPVLFALGIVTSAVFVPIPERDIDEKIVTNEPRPWEQMKDWLATLEEEEVIDESSLEKFEEKIEELRNQPEEDWYGHASMEATDTLKDSLGREIRDVADAMEALDRNLATLKEFSAQLSEESRDRLLQEFQEALELLDQSGLEMSQAMREKLAGIDPKDLAEGTLGQMSAEDLKNLQKRLGEASEKLGSMEGLPAKGEGEMLAVVPGMQPGQGEIRRGRGDAPMFFGEEDNLGTENLEDVNNTDLSRAALGELVGVGETEREIDETTAGAVAGGNVSSTGRGGDAVWRDEALLPDEKALLKRYFK